MAGIERRRILVGALAVSGAAALPGLALAAGDAVLADVIANGPRAAADKARDVWRHPYESLTFWGLAPGMTVIDVSPGAGWWTDIIAPYLARTGGRYIAAVADLSDPKVSEGARKGRAAFEAKYEADPKLGRGRLIDDLKSAMLRKGIPALKQAFFLTDYAGRILTCGNNTMEALLKFQELPDELKYPDPKESSH